MAFDKKQYMREWSQKNKDHINSRNKAYWAARPEKLRAKELRHRERRKPAMKEYRKLYRLRNLDEVRRKNREWQQRRKLHRRDYMKKYYDSSPSTFRERSRAWYRANPGKHSVHIVKRRRKQAECPIHEISVINEWMKEVRSKDYARCHWCGTKVNGSEIHFDHVVPLAKGGAHSIGNLCASCADCNRTKHARALSDWIVNGQTFLL